MSSKAHRARRDTSEPSIIEALEKCGWIVRKRAQKGVPDLVIFKAGRSETIRFCGVQDRQRQIARGHADRLGRARVAGGRIQKRGRCVAVAARGYTAMNENNKRTVIIVPAPSEAPNSQYWGNFVARVKDAIRRDGLDCRIIVADSELEKEPSR